MFSTTEQQLLISVLSHYFRNQLQLNTSLKTSEGMEVRSH